MVSINLLKKAFTVSEDIDTDPGVISFDIEDFWESSQDPFWN